MMKPPGTLTPRFMAGKKKKKRNYFAPDNAEHWGLLQLSSYCSDRRGSKQNFSSLTYVIFFHNIKMLSEKTKLHLAI